MRSQVGRRAFELDVAVPKHKGAVGEAQRFPRVLLDKKDADPAVGGSPDGTQQPFHHERSQAE